MKSELDRKVKCAVCQEPMYYSNDERYEAEVKLIIELPKWQEAVEIKNMNSLAANISGIERCYIHVRCWNELPITLHPSTTI